MIDVGSTRMVETRSFDENCTFVCCRSDSESVCERDCERWSVFGKMYFCDVKRIVELSILIRELEVRFVKRHDPFRVVGVKDGGFSEYQVTRVEVSSS